MWNQKKVSTKHMHAHGMQWRTFGFISASWQKSYKWNDLMYFVCLQIGRVRRKRECSISIMWRKPSTIWHWLMGVWPCACVDNRQSKLNWTCKMPASNVLASTITKLQNLRVASNVVASTWALVSNGMVMWARHGWRSWFGNDSNMWMILLLNVIETIFCIGLLYERGNKFLSDELFETPQQIHVVCTCHEN